ncbi:hypothetical protein MSG28_008374 [Choristoneura fumiferana]|uniref:Uncharacterized protein n=1 Tax=Choristoneura fumiferana TaxID=7141 RepID=A0ACC0J636_CHOFU|nr:hypothetical protein MSG28_008374 [Choristoneura fumiferana]
MSTRLANCALWWSFRNCSTGMTPSGGTSTSSSLPAVSCTFCTNLGRHSATYLPKSISCDFCSGSSLAYVGRVSACGAAVSLFLATLWTAGALALFRTTRPRPPAAPIVRFRKNDISFKFKIKPYMTELGQLKSVLRSLVVSSPACVDARGLLRDYRNMMGEALPAARYGYRDQLQFLRERCADCFLFSGPPNNPVLTPIVPESLRHIDEFVQKQRTTSKTTRL